MQDIMILPGMGDLASKFKPKRVEFNGLESVICSLNTDKQLRIQRVSEE